MIPYIFNLLFLNVIAMRNIDIIGAGKPCAVREVYNRSVVCVCNVTYCDELERIDLAKGQFATYTSSEAGSRFKMFTGSLECASNGSYQQTLKILTNKRHQTIKGFGGAVTDAAAYNWLTLSNNVLKKHLIDSYFGPKGIGYSMIRVPIGGTDFSTHEYAYNESPANDMELTNFTLSFEDIYYKIPMIKACIEASPTPVRLVASTWSPPAWMKQDTNYSVCGRLRPQYFRTYAKYHYKFLEEYSRKGITIWAITTTNEPANGFMPIKKFNCLGWTAYSMGLWIVHHLGPMIRSSKFRNTKILAVDDQRYNIALWFAEMTTDHPTALYYIDGVALHYYGDAVAPAAMLQLVSKVHPDKFLLGTEACEGWSPEQYPKVDLGSWQRAETYIRDIITDLNYDFVGWIDWNMCLNENGGPTWNKNFVDSPIIVAAAKGEFYKQPMYYAMGHFAKFIVRHSVKIDMEVLGDCGHTHCSIKEHVAFLTPKNTAVVVLFNDGGATTIRLLVKDRQAVVAVEAKSVVTVEINLSGI